MYLSVSWLILLILLYQIAAFPCTFVIVNNFCQLRIWKFKIVHISCSETNHHVYTNNCTIINYGAVDGTYMVICLTARNMENFKSYEMLHHSPDLDVSFGRNSRKISCNSVLIFSLPVWYLKTPNIVLPVVLYECDIWSLVLTEEHGWECKWTRRWGRYISVRGRKK
jgi:hypothetical protein